MTSAQIIKKYGHFFGEPVHSLDELKTTHNLSLTNDTRDVVNDHVFQKILKKKSIQKGDKMICKGYIPKAKHIQIAFPRKHRLEKLYRNRRYTVESYDDKKVLIIDDNLPDEFIQLSRAVFDDSFEMPYCTTVYSSIGLTITEPTTIFDWKMKHANDNWFWTAITRATSLKNIHFYVGPTLLYRNHKEEQLRRHIRAKLQSHKIYDKEQGFQYKESEFVDEDWVIKELRRVHYICAEQQCEMVTTKGSNRQWSIDRKDNEQGHIKSNCRVICVSCNKAKH